MKRSDISSNNFVKLRYYFEKVKKESKLSHKEIISELASEPKIPVSVFNETLSGLETIAKYLKENLNIDYKEIARLLNRSEKTIWQACSFAKKKYSRKIIIQKTNYFIPPSALRNRSISILESITLHLKEAYNLKFSDIALLLKRDPSTIWTVYRRAKGKMKNGH